MMVKKVYRNPDGVISELKLSMDRAQEEKSLSLCEVLFSKAYRRSTWTVFVMTIFNQWTGIDALNIYSNRIINKMNEGQEDPAISATLATILFGLTGCTGGLAAYFTVGKSGRVKSLLWCHFLMSVMHFLLAVCIQNELNELAIASMLGFCFCF